MKILIVDDDPDMRAIIKRTLWQAGFGRHECAEAADGARAYRQIHEWKPDLVLCDWLMPGLSGLDLLQIVKGEGNSVPFGFITSVASNDEVKKAIASGASFFIKKPFTAATLANKLEHILEGMKQ